MKDNPFLEFEKTNHPDDLFFKKVMSKKSSVEAYLKNFNPTICEKLDLNTLEHSNESFVDEKLGLFQSDIVYRCQLANSIQKIFISFIWEHKSSPETYVAIQVGLYLFLALHKISKEKGRKLEVILPFLFYNGAQKWQPKTVHDLFKNVPHFEEFQKYIPQFEFLFKNIVSTNELELLSIKDAFFRSAMFAMASRNNADLIIERISRIFGTGKDDEIVVLLNYILHFTMKNEVKLKEAIIQSDNPFKNKLMSTIEQLEAKYINIGVEKGINIGVEKGINIGVEKGEEKNIKETILKMNRLGFDIKVIQEVTEKDIGFIQDIIDTKND